MCNKISRIALAVCSALLIPPLICAQTAYQPVGVNGGIDYANRVIITKGMGMPGGVGGHAGQIRAAIMDAQKNYLEVSKGAYVTSTSTVENFMMKSEVIRSQVEGLVKNFAPIDTQYFDNGAVEVTVQFNMEGQFLNAVLPQDMGTKTLPKPPVAAAAPAATTCTGLIVDARGLGVRPALAPKIVDTGGNEVYGSSYVSREYAIQQGMVGYAKDPDKASASDRVAPSPIMVKGVKADGLNKTDIVISDSDASQILSMSENLSFMRQARVVILVD